jgi:hypothetical protein
MSAGAENPVLVRLALGRHCEQGKDHGAGLGRGEGCVGERVGAERMVEDIRGARQQEPRGVGEERRRRGAVTVEATLDRFAIVFAIPPGAGEVFIHVVGRRRFAGGHDTAWIVARGHAFGLHDHPPRLLPRGGSRGEGLLDAAARGRLLAIGLRQGGPLLEEVARLLPARGGLAEQHRMARQAEDEIGAAPMGDDLQDLGGPEMTIAADQEMGEGPVAPEMGEEPDQDPRIFRAGGTLPGPEAGGHQSVRGAFEHAQRQSAMALGVMVREGQCLLPMGRVLRGIEVEDNGGGGLGRARNAVSDERLRETGAVGAGHAVFEPRAGRGTGQVLRGIERAPLHAQCNHRIVPETLGIIAVGIARGELRDPLGEHIPEGMLRRRRRALVTHGSGQACREADLAVDPAQYEGAKVGRQGPSIAIGPHGRPRQGRKTALFWCRRQQKQTSCGFYGIGGDHTLFYQRLARGLCFFMNNSG